MRKLQTAALTCHLALVERVNSVERSLSGSLGVQVQELAAAKARLEQLHGRMAACEAQGADAGGLRAALAATEREAALLREPQALLGQRADMLDGRLSTPTSTLTAEMEALRSAHALHSKKLESAQAPLTHFGLFSERLARMQTSCEELASGRDRLGLLEGQMGELTRTNVRRMRELEAKRLG